MAGVALWDEEAVLLAVSPQPASCYGELPFVLMVGGKWQPIPFDDTCGLQRGLDKSGAALAQSK